MKKKRARELELVGHAGISCVNKDESEQSVALQASAEKPGVLLSTVLQSWNWPVT